MFLKSRALSEGKSYFCGVQWLWAEQERNWRSGGRERGCQKCCLLSSKSTLIQPFPVFQSFCRILFFNLWEHYWATQILCRRRPSCTSSEWHKCATMYICVNPSTKIYAGLQVLDPLLPCTFALGGMGVGDVLEAGRGCFSVEKGQIKRQVVPRKGCDQQSRPYIRNPFWTGLVLQASQICINLINPDS